MQTYITTEQATAFLEGRIGGSAAWQSNEDKQQTALEASTRLIDGLRFKGRVSRYTQAHAWPRIGAWDNEGRSVPFYSVPEPVLRACAEWALALLETTDSGHIPRHLITRERIGESDVSYASQVADDLPPTVRLLLAPYLEDTTNSARIQPC